MITHHFIWMAYIISALRYSLFAGLSYMLFYVWKKKVFRKFKIQAADPKKSVINIELRNSGITIIIFASVITLLMGTKINDYTLMYHHFGEHSVKYFIFSVLAAILLHDTYFYWTHRLMHWKRIFPYVHYVHHKSHNPTPLAAFSFHPTEALIEIAALPLILFCIPMHPIAVALFGFYMIVMNVIGHLGFELMPPGFIKNKILRLFNTSTHHNMHHHYSKSNYGLYFNFWDRIMGTLHINYESEFLEITSKAKNTTSENTNQHLNIINS